MSYFSHCRLLATISLLAVLPQVQDSEATLGRIWTAPIIISGPHPQNGPIPQSAQHRPTSGTGPQNGSASDLDRVRPSCVYGWSSALQMGHVICLPDHCQL